MWLLIIGIVVFLLALRAAISSSFAPPPPAKSKVCPLHKWVWDANGEDMRCSVCKKTPGQILGEE